MSEGVRKLIQAWNETVTGKHSNKKGFGGLNIRCYTDDWRRNHPKDFPKYGKPGSYDEDNLLHELHDTYTFELPETLCRLLLTQQVGYDDIEAFITLLLQERDKRKTITLDIPQKQ